MSKPAFFVGGIRAAGDTIGLEGSDAHKIRDVLRMRDGEEIEIVDSGANRFRARLHYVDRTVTATLLELLARPAARSAHISVAQGIPKGQKMDFVVEKLTELGVEAIVPLQCERTVVTAVSANKIERWRRLAKTAAAQCGRDDVPAITDPLSFEDLLRTFDRYDAVLLPWELAESVPLRETLPSLTAPARRILVVIGPEGGFSHAEAQEAVAAGAHPISLGPRILRTETAALVTVSILSYALGV